MLALHFSSSSRFRKTSGLLLLSLVPLMQGNAQTPAATLNGAARWADSARVLLDRAVITDNVSLSSSAASLLDKALTAFPNDPLLLHYRAYGLYRDAMRADNGGAMSDATEATLKRAIDMLERSVAARPLPETHALLASCFGALAGSGMINGMRYGSAASKAGEAARALGPQNPRVLLLAGISAWFTPSMWGGGKDKGLALVQQAVSAFTKDAPARPLPAWGAAEAYAWLGQMEKERGNAAAARAAYERALTLEPSYTWVRQSLKPALGAP